MSGVRDVIAEVFNAHRKRQYSPDRRCTCGVVYAGLRDDSRAVTANWRTHLTDAVLAALREAGQVESRRFCDEPLEAHAEGHECDSVLQQRVVLPWEPVEEDAS